MTDMISKTVLIILAHPKEGSFNHALAQTVAQVIRRRGHKAIFHDLYLEKFDPVFTSDELDKNYSLTGVLKAHCDELISVDGIVIVHPNWWGQPPAILKGWVDRVIRQGVAYRFGTNEKGEGVSIGLLKAKTALVFTTSNTPQDKELALYGDPLENLWKTCTFGLCGINTFCRKNFSAVIVSTPEQRKQWLEEVVRTVQQWF
jgi:NAD(P)H dehydrogenase (quinone)